MKQPKLSDLKIDWDGTKKMRKLAAGSRKIKITINLDSDLLDHVRQRAGDRGAPYQTYLNRLIREALSQKTADEERLDRLEREIEVIKKKVAA